MADPKPLASLSAGLLARKGAARPAMRRQAALPGMNGHVMHGGMNDDLGWNDMGYDVDPQPAASDPVRAGSHGLSPMAGHVAYQDGDDDRVVMDALSAAVDRAIDPSPYEPFVAAPRGEPDGANVEPIQPDGAVPAANEELVVHRHQQRIVDAIAPRADAASDEPIAEAQSDRGLSLMPLHTAAVDPVAPARPTPVRATRPPRQRAAAGTRGAFAFTLRLDPERHLRLRLASATSNRSAQHILIGLVDDFLASQPEIAAFAAGLPAVSSKR